MEEVHTVIKLFHGVKGSGTVGGGIIPVFMRMMHVIIFAS
jgi:hypothetical protein